MAKKKKKVRKEQKEYALKDFDGYYTGWEKAVEEGYIAGAKEQRKIDIEKACEWLDNYLMEIGYPDDWLRDSLNIKSGKERFRKAMEE